VKKWFVTIAIVITFAALGATAATWVPRLFDFADANSVRLQALTDLLQILYDGTGIGPTSAVGIFPQGESLYGLMDTSGNVWEWTATKWVDNYRSYKPDERPDGDARRVLRGGAFLSIGDFVRCAYLHADGRKGTQVAFLSIGDFVRCAYRDSNAPDFRFNNIGFRVASLSF